MDDEGKKINLKKILILNDNSYCLHSTSPIGVCQ